MFTIPAIIHKSDIEPIGAMRGAINSDTATLAGREFKPSELVFRGFAGTYDKASRKWVGVYRFEPSLIIGGELDEMSISSLPDRSGDSHPATETEMNDNGI